MVKGKSENITQKPILRASNTSELPSKRETRLGCEGIVVKLRCTLKLEFSRIVMMIESWVDPHDL